MGHIDLNYHMRPENMCASSKDGICNSKMSCCGADAHWNCFTCMCCEREWCTRCEPVDSFAAICKTCQIYMTCKDCILGDGCGYCLDVDPCTVNEQVLVTRSLDCNECRIEVRSNT